MNQQLAYPHAIRDIIAEYRYKSENLRHEIASYEKANEVINQSVTVTGGFVAGSFARNPHLSERDGQRMLLASAWKALYVRLNLDRVFSATDNRLFEQSLIDPPALTLENLKSTFGDYWENPRYYVLKGLAEAFCKLDKFYKSHTNFGIGAKGLPKRVILNSFVGHSSWGKDALLDMCRAMLLATGQGALTEEENKQVWNAAFDGQDFALMRLGLAIKIFKNGNAHVHFTERAMNNVNNALHEFYGDVLPDESTDKPEKKKATTEVSKDLAFYPTPTKVTDIIIKSCIPLHNKDIKVLEPSCGDGAILDRLKANGLHGHGIEVHAGRANQARAKGHSVLTANFLDTEPSPTYDYVLMNPPFSGRHYVKHVEHAMKFLKDGGTLITILPANAWYEHKLLKGRWTDLPIGSFKASGTNVNTGYLVVRK
ncbi:MAG TPA: DUF4942 domain-containing protein [Pseudomonadales bacterium]|nr:DUF4942 domain-containing protein [Pseudomonadales bacterium]